MQAAPFGRSGTGAWSIRQDSNLRFCRVKAALSLSVTDRRLVGGTYAIAGVPTAFQTVVTSDYTKVPWSGHGDLNSALLHGKQVSRLLDLGRMVEVTEGVQSMTSRQDL